MNKMKVDNLFFYIFTFIDIFTFIVFAMFLFTTLANGQSCPTPKTAATIYTDIDNNAVQIESLMAAKAELESTLLKTNDALAASIKKLAQNRAKLNAYLDNLGKPKPKEKSIQIVEVYSEGCQYCDTDETIAGYVKNGLNIVKTKDTKWAVTSTPTYIMTVDGKEINRVAGYLSEKTLTKWQLDIKVWANNGI